jgi:hypothetical protein
MAPHLTESTSFSDDDSITDSQLAQSCNLAIDLLLEQVAMELEWMKDHKDDSNHGLHRFPPACYRMVKSLPGNDVCMDCGSRETDWASTSYGVLLCLLCSARHRSLGVKVIFSLRLIRPKRSGFSLSVQHLGCRFPQYDL